MRTPFPTRQARTLIALAGIATIAAAPQEPAAKLIGTLEGHEDPVASVAWTPDGSKLVTGGFDHTVRVWDPESLKELDLLRGHESLVLDVAPGPDSQRVLSTGLDKTARLWDVATVAPSKSLEGLPAGVNALATRPDGQGLWIASGSQWMRWDFDKSEADPIGPPAPGPIATIALNGDGSRVGFADADGSIHLLDPAEGTVLGSIPTANGPIVSIAFSNDGNNLNAVSPDGQVRTWKRPEADQPDPTQDAPIATTDLTADDSPLVTALVQKADGSQTAVGLADGTVRTRNGWDGTDQRTYGPLPGGVTSIAYGPGNQRLTVGSGDGYLYVIDLDEPDPAEAVRHRIGDPTRPVKAVATINEPASVVLGTEDGSVRVYELPEVGPIRTFSGHNEQVYSASWKPDGTQAVTASADKTLRIWDVATGNQVRAIEPAHEKVAYAAAFSPDGRLIASGGDDKLVKLWNPDDGAEVRKLEGHGAAVYCVAFRPGDGGLLASAGLDKSIKIWNPADGTEVRTLAGHPNEVYAVAWSPDGKRLASIDYAGTLIVWDVETGSPTIRQTVVENTPCYDVAWSPDGHQLAVAASDHKVYLFRLP